MLHEFNKLIYFLYSNIGAIISSITFAQFVYYVINYFREKKKKKSDLDVLDPKKENKIRYSVIIFIIFLVAYAFIWIFGSSQVKVPNVETKLYSNATYILDQAELTYDVRMDCNQLIVREQQPKAGELVKKREKINLILENEYKDQIDTDEIVSETEDIQKTEIDGIIQSESGITQEQNEEKEDSEPAATDETNNKESISIVDELESFDSEEKVFDKSDISGEKQVTGRISSKDDIDTYFFVPDISGVYRFDMSELYNNAEVRINVSDMYGETICSKTVNNEYGLTVENMLERKKYKIEISYYSETSSYNMIIGYQSAEQEISNQQSVSDEITYKDQINKYKFVPPIDGIYRFDISELYDNGNVKISISNYLGENVGNKTLSNKQGITMRNMNGGKEYTIEIKQYDKYSSYILSIGYQKPLEEMSGLTMVNGEITYTDQENLYHFVPPVSGDYDCSFSELVDNANMQIKIYNHLNECIKSSTLENGYKSECPMKIGEDYTIKVIQNSGYSSYIFTIKMQE